MSVGLNALRGVIDNGALSTFRTLKPEWFTEDEQVAFRFIQQHVRRYGTLPDTQTLRENGVRLGLAQQPLPYYVDRMTARAVFKAANDLNPELVDAMRSRDPVAITRALNAMLIATRVVNSRQDYTTLAELATIVRADYIEAKQSPGMQGVTLGNELLDRITNGAQAGDVIVVAGRPNIGKSWKLLSMLRGAWLSGHPACVVSMEMTSKQLSRRLLGMETGLNPDMIRRGELSTTIGERQLFDTISGIGNRPPVHFLEGNFRKTVSDVDNFVQQFSPDILYVDAGYLLHPSNVPRNFSKRDYVTATMEEIKCLAQDRHIPVVMSVQLNREAKRNGKKGLDLAHLAETDAIGQIATVVIGMMKGKVPLEESTREYQIIKNREGRLLSYHCDFSFNPMSFDYREGSEVEEGDDHDNTDEITLENHGWEQ